MASIGATYTPLFRSLAGFEVSYPGKVDFPNGNSVIHGKDRGGFAWKDAYRYHKKSAIQSRLRRIAGSLVRISNPWLSPAGLGNNEYGKGSILYNASSCRTAVRRPDPVNGKRSKETLSGIAVYRFARRSASA